MNDPGFLHRYYINNSFALMDKWFHYFDIYDNHFAKYRGKSPVVLEIGVAYGGALAMWKEYFGVGCTVVGIDVNPLAWSAPNVDFFLGSQADPAVVNAVLDKYPEIDVVIDDGSHMQSHINTTFELLYSRIKPDSTYLVEDLHAAYWSEYEGGLKRSGTFIENVKDKIDRLNAVHSRGALEVDDFTKSTSSICCYDSIVVFEKRRQSKRHSIQTMAM